MEGENSEGKLPVQLRGPAQQPVRDTAVFLGGADDIAEAEGLEKADRGARTATDARRSSGRPAKQAASVVGGKEGQGYVQKWEKAIVQRRSEPRHKEMEDEAMRCRSRRRSGDRIEVACLWRWCNERATVWRRKVYGAL
ncbi:hypothetical protein CMUS01_13920 [Colletotrichum musicola]|uniref:Uncharacterized protein n=1 Tax=Colletotrichum musicola TaxID=2175873 RepID=A0A8H6J8Z9_9PEZI|nr:hypothetical protein CMUS01_13920 [Colletotrichum musicola]